MSEPHLYVLYTMSGQEHETIRILYRTVIEEPKEYLFVPTAVFHKKIHGEDTPVEQRLYPGYIFLNTAEPVDFYNRLVGLGFGSSYGKYLRVLGNFSPQKSLWSPGKKTYGKNNRSSAGHLPAPSGDAAAGDFQYQTFLSRVSDDEEQFVLALCGLKRDAEGNIVRRTDLNAASGQEGPAGPADIEEIMQIISARENPFTVSISHAVKLVKKGSKPGQRKPGDVKYRVIDGPLKGMEGNIVYVDAHRKIAKLKTVFMHREMEIRVPLAIVKTEEF